MRSSDGRCILEPLTRLNAISERDLFRGYGLAMDEVEVPLEPPRILPPRITSGWEPKAVLAYRPATQKVG